MNRIESINLPTTSPNPLLPPEMEFPSALKEKSAARKRERKILLIFYASVVVMKSTLSLRTSAFLHAGRLRRQSFSSLTTEAFLLNRFGYPLSTHHFPSAFTTTLTTRFFTISSNPDEEQQHNTYKDDDPHRRCILESTTTDDYEIVRDTLNWLQHVVMGLNLCPFAKPSFQLDQIRITVVHGENPTDVLAAVLEECWRLRTLTQSTPARSENESNKEFSISTKGGTTLVVCPDLYPDDFGEYLSILNILEEGILVDQDLTGELQIAPFHPLFEFADGNDEEMDAEDEAVKVNDDAIKSIATIQDDVPIENFTNRSPYPIFHILREQEVSKAVESLDGDASRVWQRNVDLLQQLEDEFDTERRKDDDHALGHDSGDLLREIILKGRRKLPSSSAEETSLWDRVDKVMKQFKRKKAEA